MVIFREVIEIMAQIFTYQSFHRSLTMLLLIGMLLIGMLWSNIATHFILIFDEQLAAVEFCFQMDGDSEGKEQSGEEEKDEKIQTEFAFSKKSGSISSFRKYKYSFFKSNFHPEIPTPPPEIA